MKYYSQFSVGDYELDRAEFASKVIGLDYVKGIINQQKPNLPQNKFDPAKTASTPGVRKAHIRSVKGKAQMVGQSVIKAGKSTAGKLSAGAGVVGAAGKKYGGQALAGGKTLALKGVGAGTSYVGRAGEVIAKNPKAAGIAAGVGAAGLAVGALSGRKKRKRI